MAKQIVRVITDCSQCPNADHKGGFAQIAFVPYCSQASRTIPYTVSVGPRGGIQDSIPTIVFSLNTRKIDLRLDDAKVLYKQLKSMFGG